MRLLITLVLAVAVIAFAAVALADIAPPPGYVEDCTIDKKEQAGTTCVSCGASYEDADDDSADDHQTCDEKYASTGYSYVCSTSGASYWTEVWCNGPPKPGCSLAPGSSVAPWALLVFGVLVALAMRTVRRRR